MLGNQADFPFHRQIIAGELRDPEAEWPVFKNQIRSSVVIDKLPDVPALMPQRPKTVQKPVVPIDLVADRNADPREAVVPFLSRLRSVDMQIHHVPPGLLIEENLGPFHDAGGAKVFRIAQLQDPVAKLPMRQVARRITRYVAPGRIEARGPVFPEPIKSNAGQNDPAPVGLHGPAVVVRPDVTRLDRRGDRFGSRGEQAEAEQDDWAGAIQQPVKSVFQGAGNSQGTSVTRY